jgi:hypothetical protein
MKKELFLFVAIVCNSFQILLAQSNSIENIEDLKAKTLGIIYSGKDAVGYYALYNNGKAGEGEEAKVLRFSDLQLQNDKITDVITQKKGSVMAVRANSACYFVHFQSKGKQVTLTTFTKEGRLIKELDYGKLVDEMTERSEISEIQTLGEVGFIVWEKFSEGVRGNASQRYKFSVYSNEMERLYSHESSPMSIFGRVSLAFSNGKYFGIHEMGFQLAASFEPTDAMGQFKALKAVGKVYKQDGSLPAPSKDKDTLRIFESLTGKKIVAIATDIAPNNYNCNGSRNEIEIVGTIAAKDYSVENSFFDLYLARYDLKGNKIFEKKVFLDEEFPELRKLVTTEKRGMVTNDIFLLEDEWILAGELFEVTGFDLIARDAFVIKLGEDFNVQSHSTYPKTGKKIRIVKQNYFRDSQIIIASKSLEFSYVSKDENDNCNIVYEVYKDIKDNIIEKEKNATVSDSCATPPGSIRYAG